MASFELLDQAEEDKLHATRLLGIEERPFKRLTKRLLSPSTPIHVYLTRPTKPTTEASEENSEPNPDPSTTEPIDENAYLASLRKFRSEILLDFSSYTSSIARIQFLLNANEKERQRYADEKHNITHQASEVRENTTSLRRQLEEARKMLEVRKGYDVLARKVMEGERTGKSREELRREIQGLRGEIEELEREGRELEGMWGERRERLGVVVREGEKLRRVVRGEPEVEEGVGEEAEEDEGVKGDEEGEGDDSLNVDRDGEGVSNVGTPRMMEDVSTPLPMVHESGVATPRSMLADGGVAMQADIVKDTEGVGEVADTDMGEQGDGEVASVPAKVEDGSAKVDEMDIT